MIGERSRLNRNLNDIGPKSRNALPLCIAHTVIAYSVGAHVSQRPRQRLRRSIVLGVLTLPKVFIATYIVKLVIDRPDQFSELGKPARGLIGVAVDFRAVITGLCYRCGNVNLKIGKHFFAQQK